MSDQRPHGNSNITKGQAKGQKIFPSEIDEAKAHGITELHYRARRDYGDDHHIALSRGPSRGRHAQRLGPASSSKKNLAR